MIVDDKRNANYIIAITLNEANKIVNMSLRDMTNDSDEEVEDSESNSYNSEAFSENINIPDNYDDEISGKYNIQSKRSLVNYNYREEKSFTNFKI